MRNIIGQISANNTSTPEAATCSISSIFSYCPELFRAYIKAGIHLKAVFTPPKIGLTEISRSRFKQYKNPTLIAQTNVLGVFCKFFGDF